ncbi:MAG: hypothetical protein WAM14_24405 [Candidatus Nitrosopolaris sp.]
MVETTSTKIKTMKTKTTTIAAMIVIATKLSINLFIYESGPNDEKI